MALTDKLSAIADAIRAKTGKTAPMTLEQMPGEISGITGGGSAAGCVTVTFMNGDTVLFSRPVYIGDDCPDPITQGHIATTPTKESSAQYDYTYSGWGAADNGAADSTILQNITEDKTVYAIYTATVRTYTITYYDSDGTTVLKTEKLAYGATPSYEPSKPYFDFIGWTPTAVAVAGDASYTAQWQAAAVEDGVIQMSWADISAISDAGTAANYFSVGDCKPINLTGTMGTLALEHTLYVYIIGIYHNSAVEGSGIHFGGFKTISNKAESCLADAKHKSSLTDGTKIFNWNHWGSYNYGGWAGCDLRYDILGSTNVPPSGYGSAATSGRVGYNATATCATEPVGNTLMSCLPADLREVMKPMTKWSNNVGGSSKSPSDVTATVDYLPLLAYFEIYGSTSSYVNASEADKQLQYDYYKTDRTTKCKKTPYPSGDNTGKWIQRSVYAGQYNGLVAIAENGGGTSIMQPYQSFGISPIFMV